MLVLDSQWDAAWGIVRMVTQLEKRPGQRSKAQANEKRKPRYKIEARKKVADNLQCYFFHSPNHLLSAHPRHIPRLIVIA